MALIRQLSPHVADLIAAGEVVERPASVVKELVENSIDAGTDAVTVEIQDGGMSLIRVTDAGSGIPASDVETAFLRHATSKISSEEDLEAIGTLGFRGEALAAIAAVSRIELLTRYRGEPFGVSLSLEGGKVISREEAGCPQGTTMLVRDLFYNTPARRKFVKKDSAEGAAVFAVVQRLALAHPEVSFKFLRDGKQELLTPGDSQLKSALYSVLGRDAALGFTPAKGSGEGMSVEGFISLPTCCRGTRNSQFFFVNGRYIRSRTMTAALEEAYKNQKMVGKFPGCVLHLTVKKNAVDVNVHPTKQEVKFAGERQVFDTVYYAVLSALEGENTRPKAVLSAPAPQGGERTPGTGRIQAGGLGGTRLTAAQAAALGELLSTRELSGRAAVVHDATFRQKGPSRPDWERRTPSAPAAGGAPRTAPLQEEPPQPVRESSDAWPEEPPEPTIRESAPPPREEPLCPAPEEPEEPREIPWRVVGEVLRTYIIVEQGEKILLIDKHAAHERMNFDALKAQDYHPMVQTLLTPLVFTPPAEEGEALLSQLPLLEEFGFQVEDFGDGALLVRQAPADVAAEEIQATLTQVAGKLLTTGRADPSGARDELLHTMACKAAIKGGQKNAPQELERVAAAVVAGEVKYCPHGRPVAIELTRGQLERQFGRA